MEITINKINVVSSRVLVDFSSEVGGGVAEFKGNSMPQVSKFYDVELEITPTLVWGEDIIKTDQMTPSLMSPGGLNSAIDGRVKTGQCV